MNLETDITQTRTKTVTQNTSSIDLKQLQCMIRKTVEWGHMGSFMLCSDLRLELDPHNVLDWLGN